MSRELVLNPDLIAAFEFRVVRESIIRISAKLDKALADGQCYSCDQYHALPYIDFGRLLEVIAMSTSLGKCGSHSNSQAALTPF